MNAIGGYFELETPRYESVFHHKANLGLKSGRSCIQVLIQTELPTKVWVPYYSCDSLLEPFIKAGVRLEYYAIDRNLEIAGELRQLGNDERLIYINYFGLKTKYCTKLEETYGHRLWLDQTQAFFLQPPPDRTAFHFNSARKFFGVPDGAYLYAPATADLPPASTWPRNHDCRIEHLLLRSQGKTQEGYPIFKENEQRMGGDVARISPLSELILSNIDYGVVTAKRVRNYASLHEQLGASNCMPDCTTKIDADTVPLCYPYLPERKIDIKFFWERNFCFARYWPECVTREDSGYELEKRISRELLALPIDHRYGGTEMSEIIDVIYSYGK